MKNIKETILKNLSPILWIATVVLALGLLVVRAVFPEIGWLSIVLLVLLVAALAGLIHENRKALRSRTAAYGLNSIITTVLVIAIIGVLNFVVSRYPQKLDLTKNKVHTLSDQTSKVIKGLKQPVKAIYFAKLNQREQLRPLLDNLKGINPKFEVEYVDPDKEPARAKQVGIKKYGTLQLVSGARDSKVEDPTEEKLTNALIKLLKERMQTLCAITGHGEKSFSSTDPEGYDLVKKSLANQSYEVKDVSLVQEGKIPEACDAIAILGPTKAFFDPELKTLEDYLANGGRALFALDMNIKGQEFASNVLSLVEKWNVKTQSALVVDPLSRMVGVDASVPLLATYSKDSPITRDFQMNCFFPFARPLEVVPGAPAGLNVQWLAQTTPKSWLVTDMKQLASGQVRFTPGKDKNGPFNVAISVEGKQKDSKATKNTRMVVFGTSHFATNHYSRFGGNLDFFVNATSWLMEDENLISIRAKEDGPGKVELSQKQSTFIYLLTVIFLPLAVAIGGIVIWVYRRKL